MWHSGSLLRWAVALAVVPLVVGGMGVITQTTLASGPLRVHSTNPRYFTDGSGKAVYLTGAHTWANFKDRDTLDPPSPFDFTGYLDFLLSYNHNFMRLWTWELTQSSYGGGTMHYVSPFPWPRTGPGTARDGKLKFDLNKFNESYFNRLRSRVIAARDRGMYVAIMLFEGHGLHTSDAPWCSDGHPFNLDNNINGINGDTNGDGRILEIQTVPLPAGVDEIQKAYVRKVIDTVNDLDNVLYEIANEGHSGSVPWQQALSDYVHSYETGKPKQHPVIFSAAWTEQLAMRMEVYSPGWDGAVNNGAFVPYRDNPPANNGPIPIINDTDHLWGMGGDRAWVWKSFTRGLYTVYMDYPFGSAPVNAEDVRRNMGYTRTYATKTNFASMTPRGDLTSTGYGLANPRTEYIIYQPGSGAFSVNLASGTYGVEWFSPGTGASFSGVSFSARSGWRSFTPPFSGDAVLYLRHAPQRRA
jgi:hypothetical protein